MTEHKISTDKAERNWHFFRFDDCQKIDRITNWQTTDKLTGNLRPAIHRRTWHMLKANKTRIALDALIKSYNPADISHIVGPRFTVQIIGRLSIAITGPEYVFSYSRAKPKCQILTPAKPVNYDKRA